MLQYRQVRSGHSLPQNTSILKNNHQIIPTCQESKSQSNIPTHSHSPNTRSTTTISYSFSPSSSTTPLINATHLIIHRPAIRRGPLRLHPSCLSNNNFRPTLHYLAPCTIVSETPGCRFRGVAVVIVDACRAHFIHGRARAGNPFGDGVTTGVGAGVVLAHGERVGLGWVVVEVEVGWGCGGKDEERGQFIRWSIEGA